MSTIDRVVAWYRVSSSQGAAVALVAANLIPLLGVLFLGWSVWAILTLYWLENGVVGVVNVLKILRAEGEDTAGPDGPRINGRAASAVGKAGIIPFFVIHYGIFWLVHGVFVLTMPVFGAVRSGGMGPGVLDDVQPGTIVIALIALAVSHGISYRFNYIGRGEYRHATPSGQMFAPYGRLVVLHITIIFGALAIALTGAPTAAVAILVSLKIALDLGLHLAEHRPRGTAVAPPGS